MTGVELIAAALAAGAGAGVTDTASTAIRDAYTQLKALLAGRLGGRDQARRELDAEETEPGVWQARLGAALVDSGAADDERIGAAALGLLKLVDPDGAHAGHYNVTTNYGAVGRFEAPVTFNYGQLSVPPVQPGVE